MSDSITVVSTTAAPAEKAEAPKELESVTAQDAVETVDESETSENLEADAKAEGEQDEKQSESEESDEAQEGKQKKTRGIDKRFKKLTRQLSDKDREVEYWKQEALKRKDADGQAEQSRVEAAKSKPSPSDGEPQADQFETHAEYVKALADWRFDQREKEKDKKEKETKAKSEQDKRVESFQQKVTEFKKNKIDFDDVLMDAEDIPMSLGVQEAILLSDLGPEVMYELAKNRDEYERINALHPIAAAREIGKIEARLTKDSEAPKHQTNKTTKAPAPVSPIGSKGSGTVKKSIYDKNLTQQEYEELRAEQLKARRA